MEMAKAYNPRDVEERIYRTWLESGAFHAAPAEGKVPYCIVIPPPNVTSQLHLGHALNNTLQDILVRWKRMQGYNTLWMPGTDHAGIATQTVVEKRILAEEGKRRTDFSREAFVARVQAWKDQYESRILEQLKAMGCSCDWERTRFTMDEVCARAVRAAFFRLFSDGLIYRGKRLVNWDPATRTVLADDEVAYQTVQGNFWYLRYPLAEPVEAPSSTGVPPVSNMGVSPMSNTGVPPVSSTAVSAVSSMGVSPMDEPVEKRQGARLPHWTQAGAAYAVTFRLADSMPAHMAQGWIVEREAIFQRATQQKRELTHQERKELHILYSARVQTYLDMGRGECALKDPRVAEVVQEALKHFDGDRYDLIAWSIMPNHVHVVLRPRGDSELSAILHSWKSFTAKQINRVLGRTGQLWQEEYYDHVIRDEEDFNNEVDYVLNNAAKAGLNDWPWQWCHVRAAEHGQDARVTHGRDAHATTLITHVTVATTRPETMLGDTAVAMNPTDPRAKYLVGRMVRLPIVGRLIPIIADEHVVLPVAQPPVVHPPLPQPPVAQPPSAGQEAAQTQPGSRRAGMPQEAEDPKARFSTGFLKVTPAHDPDDYAIGQRHNLPMVNVLAPDATISHEHGWGDWDQIKNPDVEALIGLDRFKARAAIVEWFGAEGLLEDEKPYVHEVGHSDRSGVPIEPYLSDQWFIAVKKAADNRQQAIGNPGAPGQATEKTECISGTDIPANSLAGLALKPLENGRMKFIPQRYADTYRAWLKNLRDWPISRQLWWGHRIPVWSKTISLTEKNWYKELVSTGLDHLLDGKEMSVAACFVTRCSTGEIIDPAKEIYPVVRETEGDYAFYICTLDDDYMSRLEIQGGFTRDEDVLDTWFSSALWPISTMGWPEETELLKTFYPTSVLCTAREIITLWVSRMVMFGQYFRGDIPFSDVYIHAMIQDGQGRKMSKSLGNGIDPLDIIESHGTDAMRFTLAYMSTETQDVRMPVEEMLLPDGRRASTSPKFDLGRNFCNKLWNAARFALMNLAGAPAWGQANARANLADRWILSRLSSTVRDVTESLSGYRFHEAATALYRYMWNDFCDWYLEMAKVRLQAGEAAPKAVLAHALDVLLRLLHPMTPFVTEEVWSQLNAAARNRGPDDSPAEPLLVRAAWPQAQPDWIDPALEKGFEVLQGVVSGIRDARNRHNVPAGRKLAVTLLAEGRERAMLQDCADLIRALAGVETVKLEPTGAPGGSDATVAVGGVRALVHDIVDRAAELAKLSKRAETLRKGIASAEAKLANARFLQSAPADVVALQRQRLADMQGDLAAVEQALRALG